MTNECRSNPQHHVHLVGVFFSSFLFYLKCLPETTSIRSVGASFVEDDGPPHAVTLEAELPRTSVSAAGNQMACLGPAKAYKAEPRHEQPVRQILLKLG